MELLKKLRINTEAPLWLIDIPESCETLFDGLQIKTKLGKEKPVGQLVLFVTNSKDLFHYIAKLTGYVGHDTLFWIAYPKKSSGIATDLEGMKSWEQVFEAGYRGQSSAAINEDWSALRVTNAPVKKPSTYDLPPAERNIPGIDFVKRTVELPADALAAVKKHKGMEAYFNALAFTHKKEHVLAILDAKKEETRMRRIEKMVEMLAQKMHAKK